MDRLKHISPHYLGYSFLFLVIALVLVRLVFAAAPNPGHNFIEVGGGAVQGDILYGSAADTLAALAKNATATRYIANTGTSNNPAWAQVDLTNGVTGILPSANGGTGMAFFTVSGPASTAKTFTFPNANATVLTSNAAVTVAQGGTGAAPGADDQVLISDSTSAATWRAINDCQGAGKALTYTVSSNTIGCNTIAGGSSALLDGSTHTDTTAGTVARGDIITGQTATPKWTRLAKGSANQVLSMDGTGTDIVWATPAAGGSTYVVLGSNVASTASNAYQNITGLSWTLAANTRYDIECEFLYDASANTIGIGIGWTGPASPLLTSGQMESGITIATVGGTVVVGNDTGSFTSASVATTNNHASFRGFWSNGANSAALQMRFRPETATANGIIIKAGSWCKYSTY